MSTSRSSLNKPRHYTWDLWRTGRRGTPAILQNQTDRLADIVNFTRAHSPYYRQHYSRLPAGTHTLEQLPPVTKQELMDHFDGWVTGPEVTREGIEAFAADMSLLGRLYLDRYTVAKCSGSIGIKGILLQDRNESQLYDALIIRGWPGFTSLLGDWTGYLRHGLRSAYITFTGGHYGTAAAHERLRHENPRFANRLRRFSTEMPLPQIVEALNQYQPTHLVAYTGFAQSLAYKQMVGRLAIRPVNVVVGSETLEPDVRAEILQAFRCTVRDIYGTNEFPYLAFDCEYNWLHVNTDWAILEPVDRDYQAVPPGQPSHNALLTNLANHIQPFVRYELGDSIIVRPDPCPCGSPFPAIHVRGRINELLSINDANGHEVMLSFEVFGIAIRKNTPVRRYQVIQTAPDCIRVRLELEPDADRRSTWKTVQERLTSLMTAHNLQGIKISLDSESPQPNPNTGKYRRVWSQYA